MFSSIIKMGNVFGAVLIEIKIDVLPPWQKFVKRLFDILTSILILVLGFPFKSFIVSGTEYALFVNRNNKVVSDNNIFFILLTLDLNSKNERKIKHY